VTTKNSDRGLKSGGDTRKSNFTLGSFNGSVNKPTKTKKSKSKTRKSSKSIKRSEAPRELDSDDEEYYDDPRVANIVLPNAKKVHMD
jgi:anti-sigma28 factor (negative regulator of flagellin synthesis)